MRRSRDQQHVDAGLVPTAATSLAAGAQQPAGSGVITVASASTV
ncbi:MAG: hypothetical protein WCI22_03030 [Actinomycetota bacterium]